MMFSSYLPEFRLSLYFVFTLARNFYTVNMYSKIGNLIWKEMRAQGYSQAQLSRKLEKPNLRFSHVFTKERIEPDLLAEISKALSKNFFRCFPPEEMEKILRPKRQRQLEEYLKDLEKDDLLAVQGQL